MCKANATSDYAMLDDAWRETTQLTADGRIGKLEMPNRRSVDRRIPELDAAQVCCARFEKPLFWFTPECHGGDGGRSHNVMSLN